MKKWLLLIGVALSFSPATFAKDGTDSTMGGLIQDGSPTLTVDAADGKNDHHFMGIRGYMPLNENHRYPLENSKYLDNSLSKKSNIEIYGQVDIGYTHFSN